ncbi:hypothetical protein [Dehalobacter restrictus]|uniref:hypothetical protein n=1 Tax=Dehalobacter restrictus TaxID=55583 RepID=UPI00338FDCFC
MKEIVKALVQLNIPSMIMVAIFAYFAYLNLQSSPPISSSNGIIGWLFAAAALLTGIYAFVHYIISEGYKGIIDTQVVAMKNLSKTHTQIEDFNQTVARQESRELPGGYMISDDVEPSTDRAI